MDLACEANPECSDLYVTQIHELKRTVKQLAGERETLVTEVERLRKAYSGVVSQVMELEVVIRQK